MKFRLVEDIQDNKVTLEVKFEVYGRYGDGGEIITAKVSGKDLRHALMRMVDKMRLYIDSDDIKEKNLTAEQILDSISESNGDGCDMIYLLKNLTTNEVLIDCSDCYEEQDWDDDFDESLKESRNTGVKIPAPYDKYFEVIESEPYYYAKECSYDIAREIAQLAKRALKLPAHEVEMLEHDINNLRSNEWVEQFTQLSDKSRAKELFFKYAVEPEGYVPGDKVSGATILAEVAPKDAYVEIFDSIYNLIDDPQFPVVEIVHDRLYPVEIPGKMTENFSKEFESRELLDTGELISALKALVKEYGHMELEKEVYLETVENEHGRQLKIGYQQINEDANPELNKKIANIRQQALEYVLDRLSDFYMPEYDQEERIKHANNIVDMIVRIYPEMTDYVQYWGAGEKEIDKLWHEGVREDVTDELYNNFPESVITDYLYAKKILRDD